MSQQLHTVSSGHAFLESPRWHGGRLYVSDFYRHQVLAFSPDDRCEVVCEVPHQPSGLGFAADGSLMVVSMSDRRVLRLRDGRFDQLASLDGLATGHLNDMVLDRCGRAYVGNFGSDLDGGDPVTPTCLARVDPDGTTHVAATGLVFPNGTVITDDERMLLIAESFAFRITAFDLAGDGSLSNRREWARFADPPRDASFASLLDADAVIPDGIALDAEGALWVADAGGQGALRVRAGGEILDRVDLGDDTAYAVALGGADGRTLFMCAGPALGRIDPRVTHRASLVSCRVAVPGARGTGPEPTPAATS